MNSRHGMNSHHGRDEYPGLGVDVIEIDRMRRAVQRWGDRLLGRVFTAGEVAYCHERLDPSASLAARFAAKEAFAKALAPGADPTWQEVEVVIDPGGRKPALKFSPRLSRLLDGRRVVVSLSHSEGVAMAAVLIT